MAGLAEQPGSGRPRPITRTFAAAREGTEIHRRRRARHGRLEPRSRGAGGDVRRRSPAFRNCTCSIRPIRRRCARWKPVDLARTLFIVSSKSGGTTEPNVMKDYFFDRVAKAIGAAKAGHRFIAVTDPGSSLEKIAQEAGLCPHLLRRADDRRALLGAVAVRPGAGGRDGRHRRPQPAQAHAVDGALLRRRRAAARKSRACSSALAMGLAGLEGRDKVTISLVEEDRRFRRLGRAADRGIDRQGRQGPDPDRWRAARRSRDSTATIASSSICAPRRGRRRA